MRTYARIVFLAVAALGLSASAAWAGNPSNPILFVTQVPMPEEVNSRTVLQAYMSCVSPFSNHLGGTAYAGRGGSLYVRFSNGQVVNLLAVADWGAIPGGQPNPNTIAVRNPNVNYAGDKALFSMVIGVPSGPTDTTQFLWQLYEITLPTQAQLNGTPAVKPVLTRVANQPAYNNVFPTYAPGGLIVFASDVPYNNQAHLLQREEYLSLPTVTGLWSLNPASASSLKLLHHSPSGAFSPIVDRAGRVIFVNWDHLARDTQAVTDSRPADPTYSENFTQTFNGSGNFADESPGAQFTQVTALPANTWDIFPEPRNFDRKTLAVYYGGILNGNAQNIFLPWAINLDGTNGELLNHVGRHEVAAGVGRSYTNDTNLVDLNASTNPNYGGLAVRNFFNNFMWPREDPLSPGTFYGSDAADLGTHGAGQIVRLNNGGTRPDGTPLNPDNITVTYVTAGARGAKPALIPTVKPSINQPATGLTPLSTPETLYRTPVPLADGNLVASQVGNVTQTDYNNGTVAQPASLYALRLMSLKLSGSTYVPDIPLTAGININTSYYVGSTLVSYNGPAWELDPVEVAPRSMPTPLMTPVSPIEAGVFNSVGVHIPTFQNYLRAQNAALSVSRDVTKRDIHDRQQPFNLKVAWSTTQTVGTSGKVYSVAWIQFLQADLRRGYLLGGSTPVAGRRVVATPLHDTLSENVQTPGAPSGGFRLGDDGSFAVIVPAGKALTWHLQDNDAAQTSQIKERFWVTFQSGEIRTCANCHGINTSDQSGTIANPVGTPTNPPQALATLLRAWKTRFPSGTVQHTAASVSVLKTAGAVSLSVSRTGGTTGPVAVDFVTADGTAQAGVDYMAVSGTLNWVDGDVAPKAITVPLLNNPVAGPSKTFTVTLQNAQFGSLGAVPIATVNVDDPSSTFDLGPGGSDGGVGGVDLSTGGGADLSTGGVDLSTGGADLSTGGSDLSTGGSDLSTGGSDLSTGGNDLSTGGFDLRTGGNDLSTGGNDAAPGPGSGGAGCTCSTGARGPSSSTELIVATLFVFALAWRRNRRR
ncbi:MAG TPA: Calx-beta domain-containing protein [Polyangia bacterium]|jgi:MYXO-CTERM domain-containing protein|nr:Calx-beta domain-containing protein [Polyangia bacterium]